MLNTKYRILLEVHRRKKCGQKLEWLSGLVKNGEFLGEDVDVLLLNLSQSLKNLKAPANISLTVERREENKNKRGAIVLHAVEIHCVTNIIEAEEGVHPSQEGKEHRNKIFVSWLIQTVGAKFLGHGNGVLDIAGGRGLLADEFESQTIGTVRTTTVDPRASTGEDYRVFREEFNDTFLENHQDFCQKCSIFVGMHPDQATEAIVDAAFRFKKPFAVIPCCVYPSLFPHRRLLTGQGVVTYSGFIQYLTEKDPRISVTTLPFEGRNKVLYYYPVACETRGEEGGITPKSNCLSTKKRKIATSNVDIVQEAEYARKKKQRAYSILYKN